jgi:hypothetical protein
MPRRNLPHYPVSYAGMWVAWTPDGRRIVASSKTLRGVQAKALRVGLPDPLIERIPRNHEPVIADPGR